MSYRLSWLQKTFIRLAMQLAGAKQLNKDIVGDMMADPNAPLLRSLDDQFYKKVLQYLPGKTFEDKLARALALRPRWIGTRVPVKEASRLLKWKFPQRYAELREEYGLQNVAVEDVVDGSEQATQVAVAAILAVLGTGAAVHIVRSRRRIISSASPSV